MVGRRGARRGEKVRGRDRGNLKLFKLNPTIRMEVIARKGFSNFDIYIG